MNMGKIIRSKRNTIALQVCEDATLLVRAPLGVGDDVIRKFILKHHKWIENKQAEILARNLSFTKKEFVNGEGFFYLGKSYCMKIVKEKNINDKLVFKDRYFYLNKKIKNPRKVFIDWYKKKAYQRISERVDWYAQRRGFQYNKVKISNAQKRWGSCSNSGNLNFTWRLIMAPMSVIDYVVVHELVHISEKNHSRSFWNKVHLLLLDYKKQREWFKKNGYLLQL
ncbi:MAG: SprT family zinc-dependent metalloprotease [Atribacterota bacterium]|jgi:predicted metal-dependent hydrolase|nr:SprT family zinc-dependent metalloprotease [Atribacterota bacterium]